MSSTSPDPLGAAQKHDILREYLEQYGLRAMVETGLYNGRGSGMVMTDLLDHYTIIDNDLLNTQLAAMSCPMATVVHGDSAHVLSVALAWVDQPALFWLDAHSWVGPEFGDDPPPSPLLEELDAILNWPHHEQSVILIDDIRQMRFQPGEQPGWPSLAEVYLLVADTWDTLSLRDVLRLTPKGS